MKYFIKSIFFFFLFLIPFYPVALFIWGELAPSSFNSNLNYPMGSYGHLYSRLMDVKKVNKVDILFLGSSLCYRGFDPRIFETNGLISFNLGSSAQTPIQTKVLLKRYLNQINPKLIIYEVEPEVFSIDGVESALDLMANDKNDLNSIKMAIELNHIKVYNTLLYSLMREALGLNSSYKEPILKGQDKYIPGGFVESEVRFYKQVLYQASKWNYNENQFIAFNEIINLIKDNGIEFILVKVPITTSLYKSYIDNNGFDSIMSSYSGYYNFNEILNLNDSLHFFDAFHLNKNGVELFNGKLIEILKENKARDGKASDPDHLNPE